MWKRSPQISEAAWTETNWQENTAADEMGKEGTSEPEEPCLQWTCSGRILTAREIGNGNMHPKQGALYLHKAAITDVLQCDERMIIGDRLGGVTFLTLRNRDTPETARGEGHTAWLGNAVTEEVILEEGRSTEDQPHVPTPTPMFAGAPRIRVQVRFSFKKETKLFAFDAICHSHYTINDFKKSVLQQLNLDPSVVLPRDWRVTLSGRRMDDDKPLGYYGVKQGSILDMEGGLRGGGGKRKPAKVMQTPIEDSTVAAFKALAIQRRKQDWAAAAEEDQRAGAVMGEGEETRKEVARKEQEKQKIIAKGLKREAEAKHNAKVSDNLEEIQQALQRLPALPEHVNVMKMRKILKSLNLTVEMVEVFCRVWLQTEALESTPVKIAKRIAPGTTFHSEGVRFRIFMESVEKGPAVNQSQLEDWVRRQCSSRFTIENVQMVTGAKDESRQSILSPAAWRIAFETIPPNMLESLYRDIKLIIHGKEFYYSCEGPSELELEVIWDNEDHARLLFEAMTSLNLSDTHMELLLTHFTRQSLDDAQLNSEASRAQLSQLVSGLHFRDTILRNSKQTRLTPRARAADNNRLLWPKLSLYAVSMEGHRQLAEAAQKCTLVIPYGIRPGLSPATCQFSFRAPAARPPMGTSLQRAAEALKETRTQAINTTTTYCEQTQNMFNNLKDKERIDRDDIESLHFYTASACTSVENLPHKVTRRTAVLLRELVNTLHQHLSKSDVEIAGDGTDHLMSSDMWWKIQTSICEAKEEIFMLFWAKGSTWTDIDTQILAEIRKGTSTWPRDRSERAKKAFLAMGASGVTAAAEKSTLQSMVFECEKEVGKELMTTCTGVKEYKQEGSMMTGGSLSLDRLNLTFLLSPVIHISWRNQTTRKTL
jgi:hypothetical protein